MGVGLVESRTLPMAPFGKQALGSASRACDPVYPPPAHSSLRNNSQGPDFETRVA